MRTPCTAFFWMTRTAPRQAMSGVLLGLPSRQRAFANLPAVGRTASVKAYLLLDGTLPPIDRIATDRPFYSGKHKKHGMNLQIITHPSGRLL